jgi:hypothetical protein
VLRLDDPTGIVKVLVPTSSTLGRYIGVLCTHISIFLGVSSVKFKGCRSVDEILPLSLIKE